MSGKTVKICLIGVDTPEVKWEGLTEEQPGWKEASEYVKNLLKGKKVLLEYDVQKYDRYGRTLAYVYLEDSTFLNAQLLEVGLARLATFPPNVRYVARLFKAGLGWLQIYPALARDVNWKNRVDASAMEIGG